MDAVEFSKILFDMIECPENCDKCEKKGDLCLKQIRKVLGIIMKVVADEYVNAAEEGTLYFT